MHYWSCRVNNWRAVGWNMLYCFRSSQFVLWCPLFCIAELSLFDSAVMRSSCGHIFWFVAIMVNANLLWNVFVWVRVVEKRLFVFRCAWYMYCSNLVVQSRL